MWVQATVRRGARNVGWQQQCRASSRVGVCRTDKVVVGTRRACGAPGARVQGPCSVAPVAKWHRWHKRAPPHTVPWHGIPSSGMAQARVALAVALARQRRADFVPPILFSCLLPLSLPSRRSPRAVASVRAEVPRALTSAVAVRFLLRREPTAEFRELASFAGTHT